MRKTILSIIAFVLLSPAMSARNYTQFVDPYIGTGGHGHVFLGATFPLDLCK